MILTGNEIKKRLGKDIIINPYTESCLNPNSYNLHLSDNLYIYSSEVLSCSEENDIVCLKIPSSGLVLEPGILYLASTEEYTETYNLVPIIHGRSSVGRLGISVHSCSGFGDVGFCGKWTLQLSCVQPVRILPGMKICQICYHDICGEVTEYQSDKYQHNQGVVSSKLFKEFQENVVEKSGNKEDIKEKDFVDDLTGKTFTMKG